MLARTRPPLLIPPLIPVRSGLPQALFHPRFFSMSSQTNGHSTSEIKSAYKKVLTIDTINPLVVSAKYAVRGELALRAIELNEQLKKGDGSLPFKNVVHCEIGNPQALDQKPLSFIRQVCISSSGRVDIGACVDGVSGITFGG